VLQVNARQECAGYWYKLGADGVDSFVVDGDDGNSFPYGPGAKAQVLAQSNSAPTGLAAAGAQIVSKGDKPSYMRIKPKNGVGQVNINKVEDVYFDKWQSLPTLKHTDAPAAPFISQRDWRLNELRKDTGGEEYSAGFWHLQENNARLRPTPDSAYKAIAIWEGAKHQQEEKERETQELAQRQKLQAEGAKRLEKAKQAKRIEAAKKKAAMKESGAPTRRKHGRSTRTA
jgi:hypothetical protein